MLGAMGGETDAVGITGTARPAAGCGAAGGGACGAPCGGAPAPPLGSSNMRMNSSASGDFGAAGGVCTTGGDSGAEGRGVVGSDGRWKILVNSPGFALSAVGGGGGTAGSGRSNTGGVGPLFCDW